MSAKKPLRYRDLRKILKSFGIEENKKRGKGSERMFAGIVDGKPAHYPIKCHKESEEKPIPVINAVRRRFNLTEEFGVTDEDFYGRA